MTAPMSFLDLCRFNGPPEQFWKAFLVFVGKQLGASASAICVHTDSGWQQQTDPIPIELPSDFCEKCCQQGSAEFVSSDNPTTQLLGIKLEQETNPPLVAVFQVAAKSKQQLRAKLQQLKPFAVGPALYQQFHTSSQAEGKLSFFAELLELLQQLNGCDHFLAAAMQLVNTLQNQWHCSRVSLGWLETGYIKLQAISQMENFEEKMELVGKLEAALEEAFDQDTEVFYPADQGAVNHDHSIYARQQQTDHLISLPLRLNGEVCAVLCCERQQQPFSEAEQIELRLLLDQAVPRLAALKAQSRPVLYKVRDALKKLAEGLFGPQHSLLKLCAISFLLLLLAAVLIKIPYRIETPIILRSKDVRQVSAPVDGYIEQVHVELGQRVEQDQLLLTLDNRDLHLEESAAVAEQLRYLREAEKARARGSLIDMKIAQAQTDQAKARLDLIRHRLQQLDLRASISGFIVEGDLTELNGAPVTKGDPLFKIARHEQLFVELKIAERDIHELTVGQTGELALIGRPEQKFPVVLEQIDPVAQSDETGNSFLATGQTYQTQADWWRPGMSGHAKIEVGERSMLWVISHRTVDFLRMLLWW